MVTIADVAQKAGVSISTVSYVMSGKRAISQKTRDRVQVAIAELGFSPHAGARSLASRSSNVIGLQAPLRTGVDVHVIMQIVTGVVTQARTHGYDILLLTSEDASALDRAARGSQVDALLVMDVESDDPRIEALTDLPHPSVLIGLPAGADGIPCVDFDFEAAGRLAVERLAAEGHRRIALIGSPAEVMQRHTSYADRLVRGFLSACAEAGISGTVHPCPSGADASRIVDEIVAADPDLTGFLVHNEAALPYVTARLVAHGQRRAQALGIIALCPDNIAQAVPHPIDSIDVPAEEIGSTAADLLCTLLSGGEAPAVRLLEPHLTVRTGAAGVTV